MNTKTDRFFRFKTGGHFSETSHYGSSFTGPDKNHVVRDREKVAAQTARGRPLWLNEINKKTPAGGQYEIESTFGSVSALNRTRATVFQSNNPELNKTLEEEAELA